MKRSIDVVSLKLVKDKSLDYYIKSVRRPLNVVKLVKELIGEADREYVIVLNLNSKLEPNSVQICGIGSLSEAIIHPREIFKSAILSNSNSILMVHSHPSGYVEPSKEDVLITKRIKSAGELIGIPLLDHIIIGQEKDFFSFAENGDLDE